MSVFYFGFCKDDELLYMDPHGVQPYLPNFIEEMNDSTYHTRTIWKLKFAHLDPSIALVIPRHKTDFYFDWLVFILFVFEGVCVQTRRRVHRFDRNAENRKIFLVVFCFVFNPDKLFSAKTHNIKTKKGEMNSIFEIHETRPDFGSISGCESLDNQSDDEFVLI